MKNFIKLLILGTGVIFTSCSDVEPAIFNGQEGNDTFISFSRTLYSLPVQRDETGSVTVTLNASTLSSSDRVFNIELIPNSSSSAANPATYTMPTTITIPAGSYQGSVVVNGVDGGLVDEQIKRFSFKIVDADLEGYEFDNNLASVEIYEVCELLADFTGDYVMVQETPYFGPADAPALGDDIVVTLSVGENEFERKFSVDEIYPGQGFGIPGVEVFMVFQCEGVNLKEQIDALIGCEGEPSIKFDPTDNPSSYEADDDSYFELTFTENSGGSCGTSAIETTLSFTKVE